MEMVVDMPRNYEGQEEFEFIQKVPVTWDETRVLHSEIGKYATFARRNGDEWFLGSGTGEESRRLTIDLDILDPNKEYRAHIYTDAPEADYEDNPEAVEIKRVVVDASDSIEAEMVAGGGQAVHIEPVENLDGHELPPPEPPEREPPRPYHEHPGPEFTATGERSVDSTVFFGRQTNHVQVTVEDLSGEGHDVQAKIFDNFPDEWDLLESASEGTEVDGRIEFDDTVSTDDLEGDGVTFDYFVRAPGKIDETGQYTFGPAEAQLVEDIADDFENNQDEFAGEDDAIVVGVDTS
jgi:hypothetical protein